MASRITVADLTLIAALAEEGSLSRAAARVHYSQPTASHHLASLERRVGGAVARRTGRGTELTELGALLARHATRVLDELRVAERELDRHVERGTLTFRVGTFPSAGAALLAPALAGLVAAGVDVSVTEAESPDLQDALRHGELHAIVAYHNPGVPFTPHADIEVRPLMADEAVLLLPDRHRLAGRPLIGLTDLRDETWATSADDDDIMNFLFLHACWKAGFEPRVAYRVNDYVMIQSLVRERLCVAVVPRLGTFATVDGVRLHSLDGPRITRLLFFAFRRSVAAEESALALAALEGIVARMAASGIDVEP